MNRTRALFAVAASAAIATVTYFATRRPAEPAASPVVAAAPVPPAAADQGPRREIAPSQPEPARLETPSGAAPVAAAAAAPAVSTSAEAPRDLGEPVAAAPATPPGFVVAGTPKAAAAPLTDTTTERDKPTEAPAAEHAAADQPVTAAVTRPDPRAPAAEPTAPDGGVAQPTGVPTYKDVGGSTRGRGVDAPTDPNVTVPALGKNGGKTYAQEAREFQLAAGAATGDEFANRADSAWVSVRAAPTSTFSADVDTASYGAVRRMLKSGRLPPADAVRVEELVNYFDYDYTRPSDPAAPFAPTVALYPAPWNPAVHVLHIGVRAADVEAAEAPPVNVVLLVDVSGSMAPDDRLPLAKSAFSMLVSQLRDTDVVSIVTYANGSRVALPPTRAAERARILGAIESLRAGGSTAGAAGLATAYQLAQQSYDPRGINRIFLATDGDFNVGVSSPGGLAGYVAAQRSTGVFLSVLGFGMGNLHDRTMQAIAQNGNGVAAYIDSISEARRVLVDQVTRSLVTVAKDVKFQVEWNPARVVSYRQIGYETRALARQDFDNDQVDASELGAGHEVTILYEVQLAETPAGGALRYAPVAEPAPQAAEVAFLRLRYKRPNAAESALLERPITSGDLVATLDAASSDIRFAAAVSAFGRLLRHPDSARVAAVAGASAFGLAEVERLAEGARGTDVAGSRAELVDLVRTARALLNAGRPGREAWPNEAGAVAFPP